MAGCTKMVATRTNKTPNPATIPSSENPGNSTVLRAPKIKTEAPPAVSMAL